MKTLLSVGPGWNSDCKVISPLDGTIDQGVTVQYNLSIPEVDEVYVKQDKSERVPLKVLREDSWIGNVSIGNETTKVDVYGKSTKGKEKLLLSYQVRPNSTESQTEAIKSKEESENSRKHEREANGRPPQRQQGQPKKRSKNVEIGVDRVGRMRHAIQVAINNKNINEIEDLVDRIEKDDTIRDYLQNELTKAKVVMKKIQKSEDSEYASIDFNTMIEISRYRNPPPMIHRLLQAVLLMLGHDEDSTQNWTEVQKLLNRSGEGSVYNRLNYFDSESANIEIAARAKELLNDIAVDDIMKCPQAKPVYDWAVAALNDIVFDELDCEPADRGRQREILGTDTEADTQALWEKSEELMREVYSAKRVKAEGVVTPKEARYPWVEDNKQLTSQVNRLQIITPRRSSSGKEFDIKREVEQRLKTYQEKRETNQVKKSRSKVKGSSPYDII